MGHGYEIDAYRIKLRCLAGTALAASFLIVVQLCLIAWKGEAVCLNEGCRIVEGLTRVSPFIFNLFGLSFFLLVALSAILARILPVILPSLRLMLLAAMAAEGVLLAYQYHVALAWCSYCLVIFGLVALCNLMVGLRQFFSGAVLVAAVNIIFALLRFEPAAQDGNGGGLEAGTAAVRPGTVAGRSVSLIYSNDCPHCLDILRKMPDFPACTIRLNPVGAPPPEGILGLERMTAFQPAKNLDLLHLFQIDTVPVLVVFEDGAFRILSGSQCIESYLACNCREITKSFSIPEGGVPGISSVPYEFPLPQKECRVDTVCPESAESVPPAQKAGR